jgi:NADH-quinone oxidoreductase subunit K
MIFSLPAFLTIGAILFALGLYTVMVRKNMIAILIGIELILNGTALNFVSFAFFKNLAGGQEMALFIIALAALEAVVAFAIILSIYRNFRTIAIDQASSMQD